MLAPSMIRGDGSATLKFGFREQTQTHFDWLGWFRRASIGPKSRRKHDVSHGLLRRFCLLFGERAWPSAFECGGSHSELCVCDSFGVELFEGEPKGDLSGIE